MILGVQRKKETKRFWTSPPLLGQTSEFTLFSQFEPSRVVSNAKQKIEKSEKHYKLRQPT